MATGAACPILPICCTCILTYFFGVILGRASGGPTLDMFMTLLHLGSNGYQKLIKQRKEVFIYLRQELEKCAKRHGERVLETPHNPISMGNVSWNRSLVTCLTLSVNRHPELVLIWSAGCKNILFAFIYNGCGTHTILKYHHAVFDILRPE